MNKENERIALSTVSIREDEYNAPFAIITKEEFEQLENKGKCNTLYFITEGQDE